MAGEDRVGAQPFARRRIEVQMQPAAMDADLRIVVAGKLPARLLVDELTEAVEEAAFPVLDPGGEQFAGDTERGEFAHRMRQQRDADAELPDFRCALIDAAVDAALLEIERQRKPANAAADDGYFHTARMDEIGLLLSTSADPAELAVNQGGFHGQSALRQGHGDAAEGS